MWPSPRPEAIPYQYALVHGSPDSTRSFNDHDSTQYTTTLTTAMSQSEKAWGKQPERYSFDSSDSESGASSRSSSFSGTTEWTHTPSPYARKTPRRRIPRLVGAACGLFTFFGVTYLFIIWLLPEQADWGGLVWPPRPSLHDQAQVSPVDVVQHHGSHRPSSPPQPQPPRHTIPDDPVHVRFSATNLTQPSPILRPIESRLSHEALTSFFVTGQLPSHYTAPPTPALDITYTWVNASSPYLQQSRAARLGDEGLPNPRNAGKRWRDNGELRGSIRSAVSSLGDGLGRVHVLSGDYPEHIVSESEMDDSYSDLAPAVPDRVGQIPQWLDWDRPTDKLQWHFHSDVWRLPRTDDGRVPTDMLGFDGDDKDSYELEEAWREVSLPNFNSFAIEARLAYIDGLSEQFIMANDDMFFLRDLSTSDFFHPLYGSVVRLESHPQLMVKTFITEQLRTSPGEWGGLQHANVLLSKRFPEVPRMYIFHQPKHLSLSLTHEASIMFSSDLTESSTRGFRESRRGMADIEFAWLVTHLRIERWREALLWTWAIAKMGDANGFWAHDARQEVARVLGLDLEEELDDSVIIRPAPRSTLEDLKINNAHAGWDDPEMSKYHFSSFDGHMPARPELNITRKCEMQLSRCFPPEFFSGDSTTDAPVSASDVFKHMTFAAPQCGDCMIMALINDSGSRGLSAFLPEEDKMFTPVPQKQPSMWERDEPILPLTRTWLEADFDLSAVVRPGQDRWLGSPAGEVQSDADAEAQDAAEDEGSVPLAQTVGMEQVSLRDWSIKLLSRYTYLWSSMSTHFAQIHSPLQLNTAIKAYGEDTKYGMICVNDDQRDDVGSSTQRNFADWMQGRWGEVEAEWERPDHPWLP